MPYSIWNMACYNLYDDDGDDGDDYDDDDVIVNDD